jgi:hypothetical protein
MLICLAGEVSSADDKRSDQFYVKFYLLWFSVALLTSLCVIAQTQNFSVFKAKIEFVYPVIFINFIRDFNINNDSIRKRISYSG